MSEQQTPTERLYAIVEQGLCIGCGLCQSVAGKDRVRVRKTLNGFLAPLVEGDLDHDTVDRIYAVCPGTRVEGLPERLLEVDTRQDNVWGPWRRMVRAWAGDAQVRYEGSTGGVMTALAAYLLKSGRVDFILQVKTSDSEPTFGDPVLSFTEADVFEAAGSRYGPAAPLLDIGAALDRNQPFAFFAKPCDVNALRNYAQQDERVDRLVKYCVVMVCGGMVPHVVPRHSSSAWGLMRIASPVCATVGEVARGRPAWTRLRVRMNITISITGVKMKPHGPCRFAARSVRMVSVRRPILLLRIAGSVAGRTASTVSMIPV